ncbi:dehydrogenase/reductase SDR family member on chromosome X-like [Ylistrum balloti]|uniref:dehydrogenase/reductase SDR family member on chromosome X-like n=1 Tax=Ylistrum balloti TaxID=509963 RepID=UPI0029058F66|nr:dehydrogenase/reductase SDR family member on chromosome X-like [Ylistrum balloti]
MGGKHSFPRVSLPRDRVVIITGGNQGIGYHTAKWIAMMGAKVIIACRSDEKATKAIKQMNTEFLEEKKNVTEGVCDLEELNVSFMKLDNASIKSVMTFVEEFKASGLKLHTLICNAGIGVHKQEYTEDGNEFLFQVNYLSHFLLTAHLLPIMKTSGPDCRVILVSSIAHRMTSFQYDEIQGKQFTENTFDGLTFYNRSKLYQIMQMFSMNRRLVDSNVTVTSIHPGVVETGLLDTFGGGISGAGLRLLRRMGGSKTAFEGAWTTINAAVDPKLAGVRDVYFSDSKPSTVSRQSRNKRDQKKLWSYTMACLKDYISEEIAKDLEGNYTEQT